MTLIDLINEFPEGATREHIVEAISEYASSRTPEELRREIGIKSKKRDKATSVVQANELEYLIFQLATGITAREQITHRGTDELPGFTSLVGLAGLLLGETKTKTQAGKYLKELAKEQGMPLLTAEHQAYVDKFNLDYVRQIGAEQLREELSSLNTHTISPNVNLYSPFLHELSKKVSQDRKLQFELFKKYTGITAREQISSLGTNAILGYKSLNGLAELLSGETKTVTKAGKYLKELVKEQGMPLLTAEHQAYVDKFNLDYVRQTDLVRLRKELEGLHPDDKNKASVNPRSSIYSPFLHELSKKVSQDRKLQLELFKKYTGITAQEQFSCSGTDEILGYHSLKCLAGFLSGETKTETQAGKYLREIAKEQGMPLLTAEHQAYVDKFNLDYVRQIGTEQLREELSDLNIHTISLKDNRYSLFLHELSKKVSQDRKLQFELFKKYTGITAREQIKAYGSDELPGFRSLFSLAGLLSGEIKTETQSGKYFKELMVEGTLASEEFQGFLQDEGIDLSDLTTVTSPEAKSRIKRELGIDVDKKNAQSKLNKSIPGGTTSGNTWRRIVSEWQTYDEASKTYLIGIHESAGPDEQDILTFMEDHRHEIEEDLGRTLFACQMKMGEMGLIQPPVEFGPANGGYREHIYPFPTLHQDTERRIELGFRNKAYLLEKGLAPDVVPVFAYGSHAKYDDGTPQSVRITTPIKYKGSDISKYTPYEQSVLATLQGYVLDPESFQKSGQSIKGKPTTDGLRILAREREDGTQYTQLSLKSRFSSNSQVIDTNALKLGNGVEVYLFKHDQADVTQENTRGLTE